MEIPNPGKDPDAPHPRATAICTQCSSAARQALRPSAHGAGDDLWTEMSTATGPDDV